MENLIGTQINNKEYFNDANIFDGETSTIIGFNTQHDMEFAVLEDSDSEKIDTTPKFQLMDYLTNGVKPKNEWVW